MKLHHLYHDEKNSMYFIGLILKYRPMTNVEQFLIDWLIESKTLSIDLFSLEFHNDATRTLKKNERIR